jgi:two-component sensor histidine kinase
MERRNTGDLFRRGDGRTFPVEFTRTPKIEDGIPVGAVVVFRDITEAKLAQERTQASLKEKEALLREIHHRVKNNLQVVCSLLTLQSRSLKDVEAKRVFEGTRRRVKAMALVHETLYQSGDLAGIDFSAYVSRLVPQLMHAYGLTPERLRVCLEVQSVVLPIDTAIPCALMLTELVSNSLKHTMAATREGELRIAFRRLAEPSWLLEVENPAGVEAADSAPLQGASFGLQLVTLLTEQLNGTVQIERTPDFRVTVVFPATERPGEN